MGPDPKCNIDSPALAQLMDELSKGQAAKWKPKEGTVAEGWLGRLLPGVVEAATTPRREHPTYVEYYVREPLEVRTSLASQAHRQDPAL